MLAPDPAVPRRDELLDERVVAHALSGRLVAEPVENCSRVYVKYRVGQSLRVVYRIVADGREHHVAARSFDPAEAPLAYRRALAAAVPAATLEPVLHVPELDAVFWAFPNDRRLATLPLLAERSGRLDRLVGRPVSPRLVAYCAERSASAACTAEDGRVVAFAKVHVRGAAERERRGLEAAGAVEDASLRVPRVMGAAGDALAVEAVAGRRLDTLLPAELPDALRRLGAALATLHERAPVPAARFERLDVERLVKAVSVIARARPDAGPAAARLLARLLATRGDAAGPAVALHGDANLRNALLDGDRVTLIDFEDASAGLAAADLGQVLARLRGMGVAEEAPATALVEGYEDVRPAPSPAALRWHTAASLLARTALPAVSRVRPPLLATLRPLLEAA